MVDVGCAADFSNFSCPMWNICEFFFLIATRYVHTPIPFNVSLPINLYAVLL